MVNEAHDPWALLREALEYIDPIVVQIDESDILKRIDTALAEHADSATPVVESEVSGKCCPFCRTPMFLGTLDGSTPALVWLDLQAPEQVKHHNPQMMGPHVVASTAMCKTCGFLALSSTETEAKSAAIAAARGMR